MIYELNGIDLGQSYHESNNNAEEKWGPYWKSIRDNLIAEFAIDNCDQIVSIRDPHKPVKGLRELLNKSKKARDKVFVYKQKNQGEIDNEENNRTYIYNGGALSFYSNKIKNIDGEKTNTVLLTDLWTDISWDGIANEGGVTLKNGKKPEKLIRRLINIATDGENDIVLDFFLGSGTTAAVAHKMKRHYIGIEQLDYGKNSAVVRLQNVINGDQTGISKEVNWQGGGDFFYCELLQWNEFFISKIETAEDPDSLLTIWDQIQQRGHLSYKVDPKSIDANVKDFKDLSLQDQKRFLLEVLDKNALYVNYSEIDDMEYGVSDEDKRLNHQFYGMEA